MNWKLKFNKLMNSKERFKMEEGGIFSQFYIDTRDYIIEKYNIDFEEIEKYAEGKYINFW